MAMSRFIVNNITHAHRSPLPWTPHLFHRFSAVTATENRQKSDTKEISVSKSTKKPKLFSPKRNRRRSLWSDSTNESFPPLSGFGHAIVEAATNMNKLLETLSPSRLIRRFKEKDESYSIKYQMPGLSKDDVKITVEDGMLFIKGERKEEEEKQDSDDEEFWSAATYGYYSTSLMLPEDAKVEEIKAEMKDGVLHVVIPKDETKKKHVKEVQVD